MHSVIDGSRRLPPDENSVHQMRDENNISVSPITGDAHVSLRLSGMDLTSMLSSWGKICPQIFQILATEAPKQQCRCPAVIQACRLILHCHISPCVGRVLEETGNTQQMYVIRCPTFKATPCSSHASRARAQMQHCKFAAHAAKAKASPKQNISAQTSLCHLKFPP